jgi:23S rRNA (pseudouridine1915-N3)-methyltransferase
VKLILAMVSGRRSLNGVAAEWLKTYMERAGRYLPAEMKIFPEEAALLAFLQESGGRTRPAFWLTDSRGKSLTSEEIAGELGRVQDGGTQLLVVGVGPADGWSAAALKRADLSMAFGRITLPHELAAVVTAEQVYRALTIRAGHPYHSGH